ncbi:MAG: DUF2142 domain-containing protein [Streptococcaceae bacterium]|jgi:hypothetical protein|nr:DUF2142 domain-containing protein [Streptococcaceae bacterium]
MKNVLKKEENIFLVIALFFGVVLSIVQPVFLKQDSQFHFDSISYMNDTVLDRLKVDNSTKTYGNENELIAIQNGTYFQNYYIQKLRHVDKEQSLTPISRMGITKNYFKQIPYTFSRMGMYLGFKLYPSLGVMTLLGRLMNLIFYVGVVFFVIKKVKAYKLFFLFLGLLPSFLIQACSLSYDSFSLLVAIVSIALWINILLADLTAFKTKVRCGFLLFGLSLVTYLSAKNNVQLLIAGNLLVFLVLATRIKAFLNRMKFQILLTTVIIICGSLLALTVTGTKGPLLILGTVKFFNDLFFKSNPLYTTDLFSGIPMPIWLLFIEVIIFGVILLQKNQLELPKIKMVYPLLVGLFIANFIVMYYHYAFLAGDGKDVDGFSLIEQNVTISARYVFPFLPVVIFSRQLTKVRIAINSAKLRNIIAIMSVIMLLLVSAKMIWFLYGFGVDYYA